MGNHLEELDEYETQQTKNIILSSLNGVDRAQKRVCKVTLLGQNDEQIPLDIVVPSELIPKPGAQSMEEFHKTQRARAKTKWVDPISKEDIDNLPLILLGLNYRKHFPQQIPGSQFPNKFLEQHPDIVFSRSKFSGKTMATGIRESGLINVIQFGYHEYTKEEENFLHDPVKIDFPDSNHPEPTIKHQLQSTDLTNLNKIEQMFLQNQIEITTIENDDAKDTDSVTINEIIQGDLPYIDESTLSIIHTLQIEDQKIHTGQDKDTIALVNML